MSHKRRLGNGATIQSGLRLAGVSDVSWGSDQPRERRLSARIEARLTTAFPDGSCAYPMFAGSGSGRAQGRVRSLASREASRQCYCSCDDCAAQKHPLFAQSAGAGVLDPVSDPFGMQRCTRLAASLGEVAARRRDAVGGMCRFLGPFWSRAANRPLSGHRKHNREICSNHRHRCGRGRHVPACRWPGCPVQGRTQHRVLFPVMAGSHGGVTCPPSPPSRGSRPCPCGFPAASMP